MSEDFENPEDIDESIGQTSTEFEDPNETPEAPRKSKFSMTVFEVMLLISLVCVSLATVIMLMELRTFGDFPGGFPWRTEEFLVK